MNNEQIDNYILENGDIMTNVEMRNELKLETMKMAGRITRLKRLNKISKGWLKDDQSKKDEFIDGGLKKMEARGKMVFHIIESSLRGLILTLPSYTCMIENLLTKEKKKRSEELFSFVGVESCSKVFPKMCMQVARLGLNFVSLHKCRMDELINKAKTNQYTHLILDYCGQLNSFYKDLQTAMNNNIVQIGGTIHLTLNDRISPTCFDIIHEMEAIHPFIKGGITTRSEHAIRTFIGVTGLSNYEIVEEFKYTDVKSKGKGSHMILVIIKRVK